MLSDILDTKAALLLLERFCHDIASPLTSALNSVELLKIDVSSSSLNLIDTSLQKAALFLKLFRSTCIAGRVELSFQQNLIDYGKYSRLNIQLNNFDYETDKYYALLLFLLILKLRQENTGILSIVINLNADELKLIISKDDNSSAVVFLEESQLDGVASSRNIINKLLYVILGRLSWVRNVVKTGNILTLTFKN